MITSNIYFDNILQYVEHSIRDSRANTMLHDKYINMTKYEKIDGIIKWPHANHSRGP